jgi:formylglycine-generating enzyme required for sulfatase activity
VVFSDVVSIQQPGDHADPQDAPLDWRPSRIMIGNVHGNVWEWVWCGLRDYTEGAVVDPVYDVEPGAYRVFRGGLWCYYAEYCRSAKRSSSYPGSTYITGLGFRPVRSAFESP